MEETSASDYRSRSKKRW